MLALLSSVLYVAYHTYVLIRDQRTSSTSASKRAKRNPAIESKCDNISSEAEAKTNPQRRNDLDDHLVWGAENRGFLRHPLLQGYGDIYRWELSLDTSSNLSLNVCSHCKRRGSVDSNPRPLTTGI
jgi:hypothetical protein